MQANERFIENAMAGYNGPYKKSIEVQTSIAPYLKAIPLVVLLIPTLYINIYSNKY